MNSLIYRTLFYLNIYGSYKLSKNSPVFWPTLHIAFDRSIIALFCYRLAFNAPDGGVPWDDLRKILNGDQRMPKVQNSEEILLKVSTL